MWQVSVKIVPSSKQKRGWGRGAGRGGDDTQWAVSVLPGEKVRHLLYQKVTILNATELYT